MQGIQVNNMDQVQDHLHVILKRWIVQRVVLIIRAMSKHPYQIKLKIEFSFIRDTKKTEKSQSISGFTLNLNIDSIMGTYFSGGFYLKL